MIQTATGYGSGRINQQAAKRELGVRDKTSRTAEPIRADGRLFCRNDHANRANVSPNPNRCTDGSGSALPIWCGLVVADFEG
jgi:hypothetical protein